jgi:hypothetical protein
MTDCTVVRPQQLCQQESYKFQVMKQLKIQKSVYFICGSCGSIEYIKQGASSEPEKIQNCLSKTKKSLKHLYTDIHIFIEYVAIRATQYSALCSNGPFKHFMLEC